MFECSRERPLRLFEVLARNRQSALELLGRTRSALEQPNRVFTIPPRERLSSTTRLAIRRWNVTQVVNTDTRIHKERERERERQINIQYVTRYTSITQHVFLLTSLMQKKNHFQSDFRTKQLTSSRGRRMNSTHFKRRQ